MAVSVDLGKSPSWDLISEKAKKLAPRQLLAGFPFNEGFPTDRNAVCEIILCEGTVHEATLQLDAQYRAEGISWKDIHTRENWPKTMVAAWRIIREQ